MTDPDARIRQLEAELASSRAATVGLITGLCFGLAPTTDGQMEFANRFNAAAADPGVGISELARMVAEALRDAAEKAGG